MSESTLPPHRPVPKSSPAAWSRDIRLPAAPVRVAVARHPALEGLAAFDWQWRHRFALQRLTAQLASAEPPAAAPVRAGDIDIGMLRRTAAELAGGADIEPALAMLLGAYVALPSGPDREAVALAAATAARLGLVVHVACAELATATALAERIRGLLPADQTLVELKEQVSAAMIAGWPSRGVVCGPLSVFAHAWLRLGGSISAVARAATVLGGSACSTYPYAPLLLLADGDLVLLDSVRQPLQITEDALDDAVRLAREALALVADWHAGSEYEGDQPTAAGAALIAAAQRERGGVWAVPRVRDEAVKAALTVRRLADGREYRLEGARVQWLQAHGLEDAALPAVERALLSRHGKDARRVRRRVSILDFLDGYARIGASGALLDDEWRDLWLLHGMPVLQPPAVPLAVRWLAAPARSLLPAAIATDAAVAAAEQPETAVAETAVADTAVVETAPRIFAANRRLVEEGGVLPADTPVLEQADARAALTAALAEGREVVVVGIPAARRVVPAGVSAIILAADDPTVPAWLRTAALHAERLGRAGRALAQLLAALAVRHFRRQRYQLRGQLAKRREQERRTWAFAAGAVAIEQEKK